VSAFEYTRPDDVAAAVALVSADPGASYLAGGTTQLDLLLKDGVVAAERLVDIGRLPLHGITRREDTLRVGALTTMEELAADPTVTEPGGGRLAARGGGGATHRPPARAAGTARLGGPA
jgi:CO/xanthine dehydrogenase FAD-binding subunit